MGNKNKYNLVGIDGNAFSVIAYVERAMRHEKKTTNEIQEYRNNAMSSDYNHLLFVSMAMIDELNEKSEK